MWTFVLLGTVLLVVAVAAVLVRRRRHRSPAAEYQRNVDAIRLANFRQTKPRPTRQLGDPPGYVGGVGPPVG
jgi:hypothetical protein